MTRVEQIVGGIYRITDYWPEDGLTVNQFVLDGEQPVLVHTGTFPAYEQVRKAVAQVLDPKRLRYVIVPHFEADECGGMGRFVAEAPEAVLVCSATGMAINLSGWDYSGPVQGVCDGDMIDLGEHRLRFLETPHVHHWDSMMVFEETTRSLFPADLFLQPGEQPAVVRENLGEEMCAMYREAGLFAAREPVLSVVERLEAMAPEWIHPMHGGSLPKEALPYYVRALQSEPFTYEGKIFGRRVLG